MNMKRNFFLIALSGLCLLTSCFKDTPQEAVVIDYIITGNETRIVDDGAKVNVPIVYKTDKVLYTLDVNHFATDVTANGDDLYICGCAIDEDNNMHPCIWKNGKLSNSSLQSKTGYITKIVCNDNAIYCMGNFVEEDGVHGFIAKNDEIIFCCEEPRSVFDAFCMDKNLNFYVAGHKDNAAVLWTITKKDKEYNSVEKVLAKEEGKYYTAGDIGGFGYSIFIGWNRVDMSDGKEMAFYTRDISDMFKISGEQFHVNSIAMYNNSYLYLAGYSFTEDGQREATTWCDGNKFPFFKEKKDGNSEIFKYVYDGVFQHILVHTEGKMTLVASNSYQNVSLDFDVAKSFVPSGLYITYKKGSSAKGTAQIGK